MKKPAAKHFLLLSAPALILFGFGLMRSTKFAPQIQSVRIKTVTSAEVIGNPKGIIAIDVFLKHKTSFFPRLTEAYWSMGVVPRGVVPNSEIAIDPQYGVYIEDERGVKYGFSATARDRKTFRPFVYKPGEGLFGIRAGGIRAEGTVAPYGIRFLFPLNKIPTSSGKLTLKTVLILDKAYASDASARLPISIVVRQ